MSKSTNRNFTRIITDSCMSENIKHSEEPIKEEDLLKGVSKEDMEIVPEQTKSIMMTMISQLRWGMDLTKIMIPCEFLEPRSLLEKLTDFISHCDIVCTTMDITDPRERFINVVKWYLTGWHVKSPGVKKPYNPILGELFRSYYDFEDGSRLIYFAEQVSHHPPISALYGENKEKGLITNGWYYPKSRFYGNSAASLAEGELELIFTKLNEKYYLTWPDIYVRGVILGKLVMECCGEPKIYCKSLEMEAKITFVPKPWFGGEYNCVQAQIFHKGKLLTSIDGKWNDQLFINKNKKKELIFDVKKTPVVKMNVPPMEEQMDCESRNLWKDLTRAIKENNMEGASSEKDRIETINRKLKKELEDKGQVYKQKWFKPGEHGRWIFIGQDSEEYKALIKQ